MLLLSQGDDSASLPIDPLQHPSDAISVHQNGMEGDLAVATGCSSTPVSKTVEGDRDALSVRSRMTDEATQAGDRALLPPSFAAPPNRPSAFVKDPSLPETELDGLYALRQAALLKTQQPTPARERSLRIASTTLPEMADVILSNSYAAPLAPLRERDITALSALFERDDIYAIETDVKHRLLALMPEPCWDDDVFAFLHEFL